MSDFPIHPAAEIMPDMTSDEFQELIEDRYGRQNGFARYQMTKEGDVMTPTLIQLIEEGKLFLPLPDGIVTHESDAELACQRIRESDEKVPGIIPLVRIK